MGQQHVKYNAPTLNNNVFNIQLQYNINKALDPESRMVTLGLFCSINL